MARAKSASARTQSITARVSQEEFEVLHKTAADNGLGLSVFARNVLMAACDALPGTGLTMPQGIEVLVLAKRRELEGGLTLENLEAIVAEVRAR